MFQTLYGQTAAALYAKAAGQNAQARQLYNASADTYYTCVIKYYPPVFLPSTFSLFRPSVRKHACCALDLSCVFERNRNWTHKPTRNTKPQ